MHTRGPCPVLCLSPLSALCSPHRQLLVTALSHPLQGSAIRPLGLRGALPRPRRLTWPSSCCPRELESGLWMSVCQLSVPAHLLLDRRMHNVLCHPLPALGHCYQPTAHRHGPVTASASLGPPCVSGYLGTETSAGLKPLSSSTAFWLQPHVKTDSKPRLCQDSHSDGHCGGMAATHARCSLHIVPPCSSTTQ